MYLHRAFVPHPHLPYSHPTPLLLIFRQCVPSSPLICVCCTHPPLCCRCRECVLSSVFAILTSPFVSSSHKETKEAGKPHASDNELKEQQDATVDPPNTNLISGLPHSWTPPRSQLHLHWGSPSPSHSGSYSHFHSRSHPPFQSHSIPFPAIALFLTTVHILFLHDEWLTGIRIATSFFTNEYWKSTFHTEIL